MSFKRWILSLILALVLGLILSGTAFAQTARLQTQIPAETSPRKIKDIEGSWNLRMQELQYHDDFNQKNTTEFRVLLDLKYKPLEKVAFHLVPKFTYSNGYAQTEDATEASQSTWGVKEAAVDATPFSFLTLSAGALDQSADHPALLLYDQAFPSLRVKLMSSDQEVFSGGVRAETAIPTSSSLSTQTREFEKTPSFSSAALQASLQKTVVEGNLSLGVYQFQNLPMSVATKSTYVGNTTVSSTGANDSQFQFDYQGPFAAGELTAHLHRSVRLVLDGEWVKNSKAPEGLNQGTRSIVKAEIDVSRSLQIIPSYEFFRIEPDASVSLYNAPWLNTNRIGYNAGFGISYRKILTATISGGERDVVYTTPFQQREQTWTLKLETFDVAI